MQLNASSRPPSIIGQKISICHVLGKTLDELFWEE